MELPPLCMAIDQRRVVQFTYHGSLRVVEAFALWRSSAGAPMLLGWQHEGSGDSQVEPGWRDYRIGEMTKLTVTEVAHSGRRLGYRLRRGVEVICELDQDTRRGGDGESD